MIGVRSAEPSPPTPPALDRFTFVRRLGAGAFATVWLAHDEALGGDVAIKVLADNWMAHLDVRERILEEARLQRRADSPWIATIFDLGELDDGRPYLVMSYADRGTLADRLADGPLGTTEAVRRILDIAEGLEALHERGILHRDLKPSNILFQSASSGTERMLIADLGLAKLLEHASQFTFGTGTIGYAAPEQLAVGGDLDVRADVYSLGALGRALLLGHPSAPRTDAAPSALLDVLDRATATDRDDRPDDVAALRTEIVRAAAGEAAATPAVRWSAPIAAPPSRWTQQWSQQRSRWSSRWSRLSSQLSSRWPSRWPSTWPRLPGGRPRLVVLGAMLAAVALATGLITDRVAGPGMVRVSSAAAGVSLAVPSDWAEQAQASRWLSTSTSSPASGFVVSSDTSRWADPESDRPGAFVALGVEADRGLVMAAATHSECESSDPVSWGRDGFTSAMVTRWSGCPAETTYVEAVLGASGGRVVYLQVKNGSVEEAVAVLDGLSLL